MLKDRAGEHSWIDFGSRLGAIEPYLTDGGRDRTVVEISRGPFPKTVHGKLRES